MGKALKNTCIQKRNIAGLNERGGQQTVWGGLCRISSEGGLTRGKVAKDPGKDETIRKEKGEWSGEEKPSRQGITSQRWEHRRGTKRKSVKSEHGVPGKNATENS